MLSLLIHYTTFLLQKAFLTQCGKIMANYKISTTSNLLFQLQNKVLCLAFKSTESIVRVRIIKMIQLSLQSYLRFIVLRAQAVFGTRQQSSQRPAKSPVQVIAPASNSDKTILNSLQLWLNYCLVFKITWDFFQNLSSPWFGVFLLPQGCTLPEMFSEVLVLQEHEHRDKTSIDGFHYTI